MEVSGTVIKVDLNTQVQKNGGGTYPGSVLMYEDHMGRVNKQAWHEKAINNPANAHIKTALATLLPGDGFTMTKDKPEGAQFWNITGLTKGASTGTVGTTASSGGPIATSSEDLPKHYTLSKGYATKLQTFPVAIDHPDRAIIRQNALTNAVAHVRDPDVSPQQVLEVAKIFESYTSGDDVEQAKMEMNLEGLD